MLSQGSTDVVNGNLARMSVTESESSKMLMVSIY